MKRLARIALFVAAVAVESFVRPYLDVTQVITLPMLLVACAASQGYLHSAFYSRKGIHLASEIHAPTYFLLAYCGGMHPIPLAGAALIGVVPFQGFINQSAGRPFIDPGERSAYEVGGRNAGNRFFVGRRRWLQLVMGVGIVAAWWLW